MRRKKLLYMNNLMMTNLQRMTSLEIADVTGKPHNDVLTAIRKMEEAWVKVRGGNFSLSSRIYEMPNGGHKEVPCYNLTKTECLYIATKFNDEARARLVLRWEQLERERIQAGAVRHLLVTDADVMDEAERIVGVELACRNQDSNDCFTVTQIAKEIGIDARDLNSFLCDQGIQRRSGGQFRLTPAYEGRGLAENRLFIYYSKSGKKKEQTYLVWTPKGADFIVNAVGR